MEILYMNLPNTKWFTAFPKGFTWCGPSSNKAGWVIDHWGELRIQVREQVLDAADGGEHKFFSSALAKKNNLQRYPDIKIEHVVYCVYITSF